jgi:hypothetical protein
VKVGDSGWPAARRLWSRIRRQASARPRRRRGRRRREATIAALSPTEENAAATSADDLLRIAGQRANVPAQLTASSKPREFFIHGVTSAGRPFRPSDWAERLCGVMSVYRPAGAAAGRDARIGYSPYVRPMLVGGVKCVVVDERLGDLEPMAFSFVMNFARDNDLAVYEGCSMPGTDA